MVAPDPLETFPGLAQIPQGFTYLAVEPAHQSGRFHPAQAARAAPVRLSTARLKSFSVRMVLGISSQLSRLNWKVSAQSAKCSSLNVKAVLVD